MTDYISREAALNFEMEIEADPDEIQAITKGMALYSEYIKSIPAAVTSRYGFWVKKGYDKPRCSECGSEQMCNHGGKYKESNYCPNCGADMRGVF